MTDFQTLMIDLGARLADERVVSFGVAEQAYPILERGTVAVPLLGSTVLKVTGADRLDFVHGQLSGEVKRLAVGTFGDGLLLNHRGHALAQLRVLRRQEDLLLVIEGGAGERVREQLEQHIIFDQVELELLRDIAITLQGATAAEIVETLFDRPAPEDKHFSAFTFGGTSVLVSPSRRSEQGGYDLAVAPEAAPELYQRLLAVGATAAGEETLDLARVVAGIPNAEHEGGEGVLPQEAGLEPLVSYTKGCYLGQEIMARIEARGNLRRALTGLRLEALPEAGERDIVVEEKKVGRLGTLARHPALGVIALAVLRRDVEADASLRIGEISGRQVSLPFPETKQAVSS